MPTSDPRANALSAWGPDIPMVPVNQPRRECGICGGVVTLEKPCGCLDLVDAFHNAMLRELEANAHKGGRGGDRGWKAQDYRILVGEVLYHAAKLSYAARQLAQGDGEPEQVLEFAADTANMALMVADSLGVLDPESTKANKEHPDG